VIDVLEDWDLPFQLANAVKYIARCRYKGKEIEDLKKAIWYVNRYVKFKGEEIITVDEILDGLRKLVDDYNESDEMFMTDRLIEFVNKIEGKK
jgi:hypothetical protein